MTRKNLDKPIPYKPADKPAETEKRIVINMTGRRPVSVIDSEWPIVAHAEYFSGPSPEESVVAGWLTVRRRGQGRTLVFGSSTVGDQGELIPTGVNAERAIRHIATELDCCPLAALVLNQLEPEAL